MRVVVKPISTERLTSRLGAFEVQLYSRREEGKSVEEILHSKLRTGQWPNLTTMLERIHFFQQRLPLLTVQVFSEDASRSEKEALGYSLAGIMVTIKPVYKETGCQKRLQEALQTLGQDRLHRLLVDR